jgi:hypothetical protein
MKNFLAYFKKWKKAYQITSLSVGPPLITFEPISRLS